MSRVDPKDPQARFAGKDWRSPGENLIKPIFQRPPLHGFDPTALEFAISVIGAASGIAPGRIRGVAIDSGQVFLYHTP